MLFFLWITVLLVIERTETVSIVYSQDPSSLKLTCNPYGEVIKLSCTLQEPATLTSPLSLHVHWYWSENEKDPYTNGCQLHHNSQCSNNYIEHTKYMFEFKRYSSNESWEEVTYQTLDLTIRNVSLVDIGCYFCQSYIDDVMVQNESSEFFCLQPKSHYENYLTCNKDSNTTISTMTSQSSTSPSVTSSMR